MQSILCFRCLSVRIEKSDPECRVCSGSSSSPTRCCKHQACCFDLVICCDESLVKRAQSDGPRFTYPIHGGWCLASIPYYAVEADETMCDRARSLARYLSRSRNMLHPRSRQPLSGLDRISLSYAAGRQAAKVLRGEETRQEEGACTTGRSPGFFIVLRGVKSSDYYPRHVSTFADFKEHVYQDWQILRPTHLHPFSVSGSFFSQSEAWAYCLGAGLQGYIDPCNDDP
jgi:hypothetical protein